MQLAADGIIIINYNIIINIIININSLTAKKPSSLPKNWPNSTPEVYNNNKYGIIFNYNFISRILLQNQ